MKHIALALLCALLGASSAKAAVTESSLLAYNNNSYDRGNQYQVDGDDDYKDNNYKDNTYKEKDNYQSNNEYKSEKKDYYRKEAPVRYNKEEKYVARNQA